MSSYVRYVAVALYTIEEKRYILQINNLFGGLCDIWFPIRLPKRSLRGVRLTDFSLSLAPVPGESVPHTGQRV